MKPSQEVGLIAIKLAQASGLGEEQAHLFYMCAVCAVLDRLHDRLDAIERPITKDPIDFAIRKTIKALGGAVRRPGERWPSDAEKRSHHAAKDRRRSGV